MDAETLNFWANVAAIYMTALLLLVVLVMGVVLGVAWWYLRKGRKALALPFLYGQVYALKVQRITMQACDAVVRVPMSIESTLVGARTAARAFLKNGG